MSRETPDWKKEIMMSRETGDEIGFYDVASGSN